MKVDISNSVCYVKIVKEMKKGITENGGAFYFYEWHIYGERRNYDGKSVNL